MIKKAGILLFIILITPIITGLYGVVHNQISFTISPEYFTEFKFEQFRIAPAIPYRLGASFVGWSASWWMGVPLGIILGLLGLIQTGWKHMLKAYFKSLPYAISAVLLTGICGLIYGKMFLIDQDLNWVFPEKLIDRESFIAVGTMHNFSYIGGITGLIAGVIYQIRYKLLNRAIEKNTTHS